VDASLLGEIFLRQPQLLAPALEREAEAFAHVRSGSPFFHCDNGSRV